MQQEHINCKEIIEQRIEHGLCDLEIAQEQILRHRSDMPANIDCRNIAEHLAQAIDLLRELYI